jgi:hypothetical protein
LQKVGKGPGKQEEKMNQIEEMQTDFDKLSQTLRSVETMLLPLIWEKMNQIEEMQTDL